MFRKLLDRLHPAFSEGGRFEKLYPLYEAADTFLYTPADVTKTASHVRDAMDLKRMMILVVAALGPCFFMACHNTGYQANLAIAGSESVTPLETWREPVLTALGVGHDPDSLLDNIVYGMLFFVPVYAVTVIVGGLCEVAFSIVRRHDINEGFLVTSALFPLTLPPTIPLWQTALGIAFGVVIGKEIFGGTGKNFLNPALTGRAYLYFAHAPEMSGDKVWTAADGFTGATPLGVMATAPVEPVTPDVSRLVDYSFWECFFGYIQGSMGETSTLAVLFGAAVLITLGIGSWTIMAGSLIGAVAMSSIFWGATYLGEVENPMFYVPPWWHLVIGSFAFGTVFMATDPVSAAMTKAGKWWYGGLIGVLTILIRVINPAYPEGIMLAILFGNVMAPLIDYFVIQANIRRRQVRYATG